MDLNRIKNAIEVLSEYENYLFDQDEFAKKFASYVISNYTLKDDRYYMKTEGLQHVNRNIDDVLENFYYQLKQNRF